MLGDDPGYRRIPSDALPLNHLGSYPERGLSEASPPSGRERFVGFVSGESEGRAGCAAGPSECRRARK